MSRPPDVRVYTAGELALREAVPGSRYWAVTLPNVMLTYFTVDPHVKFEAHSHAAEQITYVLRGTLVFDVEGESRAVRAGEVIRLPANVVHAAQSLDEPVEAVDAWSPPAEEPWDAEAGTGG